MEDVMKRIMVLILSVALFAPLDALAQSYNLDPFHSAIQFKVKHLMITNVKGVFEKLLHPQNLWVTTGSGSFPSV